MRGEPNILTALSLPPGMSAELIGYKWTQNLTGQSGGAVYKLQGKPGSPDLFLKYGKGTIATDILDEVGRMQWMVGHAPVPHVSQFFYGSDEAWLLMTALPGRTAYDLLQTSPNDRSAIVDQVAVFLRRFHSVPPSECPFSSGLDYRLARARERIDAGMVDENDFDDERKGWTAEQVWEHLRRLPPFTPDLVVTHGDFSLDNLLIHEGKVTGCIDVGRVGIADRYQDLAIIWNGLSEFGEALRDRLIAKYGIANVDHDKLQFHLILDELF